MNAILVKLFATALTLGQVTTRPEAVKTAFDPVQDRGQVAQILRDGCAHMRKAFDIEDINLDDLIATAMQTRRRARATSRCCKASTSAPCTRATASSARARPSRPRP